MLEAGDLGEEGEVAAGRLGPALDDVPGDDRAGQRVPVVPPPAVMPGGRPQRQGGVGDPAGDDDVGAAAQRLGDAPSAEVGVGGEHRAITQRLAGVHVCEVPPAARNSSSRGSRLSPST